MQLDENFLKISNLFKETLTEKESYIVMANILLEKLKVQAETSKYSYQDLLDYNYVSEYLHYNSRDTLLVLAHTAHTLLFLSQQGD